MAGRMQDKVVIVTGAASGIGLATAKRLAEEGARVVMTDRNPAGEQAAAGIPGAEFLIQDVTKEDRWVEVIGHTVSTYGKLDGLANNAGVGSMNNIEEETLEQWRFVHAVNTEGVFLGCKHAVRAMKQTGGGSIVNVSSVAGLIGAATLPAYCSSKGAVRLLSKSVAVWCAERGYNIRCNSLHPSFLETAMVQSMIDLAKDGDKMRKGLERASPMGRMGKAEDAANMMLFLLSDESVFVTGAEFVVDGGTTAR
ncbi:glucose 1-dehydrogenase [Aerophototrophica crusticola]|uniref:Glucose 1-dehydrogenase n=1 Tax=Aerophototrophica crusticola TaxID=1709002 RepID=A0A858R7X1_9PROT|nr:glucose 1-dehydrogenase [Rhodospirillaceae bacterium B3]